MKKHFAFLATLVVLFGCSEGEQAGPAATESQHLNIGQPVLNVGQPAPDLVASGWLNASPPSSSQLDGKVVVVDVWAYW